MNGARKNPSVRLAGPLLLLLSLSAPAARAQDQWLDKGVAAYENFEYQQAVKLLEKALSQPDNTPQTTARIQVYLGVVRFTLGDQAGAEKAFRQALETDYQVTLPPDTSPKIAGLFEKVKKTVPPPVPAPLGETIGSGAKAGSGTGGGMRVGAKLPPPPPRRRLWTWIALGVGGAALATGGAFAYLAASAKNDFDKEPFADRAAELKSTVESRSLTANILLGSGAALAVTGVVLFFLEGRNPQPEKVSAVPQLSLSPAGLQALWRF